MVVDHGKLEAAFSSIGYAKSNEERAAMILKYLVCNHAFFDGNKRTAVVMSSAMLGRELRLSEEQISKKIKKWDIDLIRRRM